MESLASLGKKDRQPFQGADLVHVGKRVNVGNETWGVWLERIFRPIWKNKKKKERDMKVWREEVVLFRKWVISLWRGCHFFFWNMNYKSCRGREKGSIHVYVDEERGHVQGRRGGATTWLKGKKNDFRYEEEQTGRGLTKYFLASWMNLTFREDTERFWKTLRGF